MEPPLDRESAARLPPSTDEGSFRVAFEEEVDITRGRIWWVSAKIGIKLPKIIFLQYHEIYPCESDLLERWKLLHRGFISRLPEEEIFFTGNDGGKLVRAGDGLFREEGTVQTDHLDDTKDAILLQGGLNLVKVQNIEGRSRDHFT